jgi:hypothetical protein
MIHFTSYEGQTVILLRDVKIPINLDLMLKLAGKTDHMTW